MDNLMDNDQPEKVIWEHLKFIRKNYKNLKDDASHRRLMVFDENSRVETFTAFPESVIKQHKERHELGEKVYVGPTRHQLRKGWKEGDTFGEPNQSEIESGEEDLEGYQQPPRSPSIGSRADSQESL